MGILSLVGNKFKAISCPLTFAQYSIRETKIVQNLLTYNTNECKVVPQLLFCNFATSPSVVMQNFFKNTISSMAIKRALFLALQLQKHQLLQFYLNY